TPSIIPTRVSPSSPTRRSSDLYFSLYQACERGTSWLGTLAFGVMHQLTGSYRPAILALIMFFAIGAILLYKVNPHKGIRDVGNRSEEHTSELQSRFDLVCRLLL